MHVDVDVDVDVDTGIATDIGHTSQSPILPPALQPQTGTK